MGSEFDSQEPIFISAEDRVNAMRGYKATINNRRVSEEAKCRAQEILDNDLQGDKPRHDLYEQRNANKEPNRVAGGLKAAMHNPHVSEDSKKSAQERLGQISNR